MGFSVKEWARATKRDKLAAYFAVRDSRTPWYAKAVGLGVVAYALSPIDLIPDFIPIVGYLDDAVLVPLGLWIVIRLIPKPIMDECRARAETMSKRPVSRVAAVVIVGIWLGAAIFAGAWIIVAAGR